MDSVQYIPEWEDDTAKNGMGVLEDSVDPDHETEDLHPDVHGQRGHAQFSQHIHTETSRDVKPHSTCTVNI